MKFEIINPKTTTSKILKKSLGRQNPYISYGIAILAVVLAIFLNNRLTPFIQDISFEIFIAAIVITTYYSGIGPGPGILSVVLSSLALNYFFIPPLNAFTFGITDLLRILLFAVVAILISSLSGRLKKAKLALQHERDDLEFRIQNRTIELSEANTKLKEEIIQRLEAQKAISEISNREQQRLGQDLHDGLCQILAGVRFMTKVIKDKLAAEKHPLSKDIVVIETRLREALSQADTLSRGLYPVELENNGLMAALDEMVAKVSKLYEVEIKFKCPNPILIHDSAVATQVYRIAQEAVTNAIKSGKAKRIRIHLYSLRDRTIMNITDNGIGFKKEAMRSGMGLKIMAYRATLINANLRFRSGINGGTVVQCAFKIEREKETIKRAS